MLLPTSKTLDSATDDFSCLAEFAAARGNSDETTVLLQVFLLNDRMSAPEVRNADDFHYESI